MSLRFKVGILRLELGASNSWRFGDSGYRSGFGVGAGVRMVIPVQTVCGDAHRRLQEQRVECALWF